MPPSIMPFIPGSPGVAGAGSPMPMGAGEPAPGSLPPEIQALLASLPPEQIAALVAQLQGGAGAPAGDPAAMGAPAGDPAAAGPGPGPAVMPPEMAAAVEAMPPGDAGGMPPEGGAPADAGGMPPEAAGEDAGPPAEAAGEDAGPPAEAAGEDAGPPAKKKDKSESKADGEEAPEKDEPEAEEKSDKDDSKEDEKCATMLRTAGAFLAKPAGLLQKQSSTLEHADGLMGRSAGPYMARR